MTVLEPKPYQERALECLKTFLTLAQSEQGAALAFQRATQRMYQPIAGLEQVPSVCLKIPTGGGKTMLAAMSIPAAARCLASMGDRKPLVVWLVPSDTIRTQTLRALQNPDHPYRTALRDSFGERVRVLDMAEFRRLTPHDLDNYATLLVGTMQGLLRKEGEQLKTYRDDEGLEGFGGELRRAQASGMELAGTHGRPWTSFVNVLRVRRPLVILDEAHKFWSELALEIRQRILPAAILEFTATPDERPNVLFTATARELSEAEMIKLPVMLTEHRTGWQTAVAAAVQERKQLAELAAAEPEYLRPLLLIQAEPATATAEAGWEVVRDFLVNEQGVRMEEIAVETGAHNDLKEVDLFARECPITTVLTVKKLQEGWDCSFAYVLCSVANTRAAVPVEQLLGRVLRMPYARRREQEDLNRAYVHASSFEFGATLTKLQDGLVQSGFSREEAQRQVKQVEPELSLWDRDPDVTILQLEVERDPQIDTLPVQQKQNISVADDGEGKRRAMVRGPVSPELEARLVESAKAEERDDVRQRIAEHNRQLSPAEQGKVLQLPLLSIDVDGEIRVFDGDQLFALTDFILAHESAELSGFEFEQASRTWTMSLLEERFTFRLMENEAAMQLFQGEATEPGLIEFLDEQLHRQHFRRDDMTAWLRKGLEYLRTRQGIDISLLHQQRYLLREKFEEKLKSIERSLRARAYQRNLFGAEATATVDFEKTIRFPKSYGLEPDEVYRGLHAFRRHYHKRIGNMRPEEAKTAVELDALPEVEYWVRNLERRPTESFWLQTQTDRFYPDFVAQLTDGRWLVVEHKGADRSSDDDSKEKRDVGAAWARLGGSNCLFVMVEGGQGPDSFRQQLRRAIPAGIQ